MGEFSLNGPGMKAVRQSVSRLQRRGYTTRGGPPRDPRPTTTSPSSATAAGQWRGDGGDERGFSMALGRLGDPLDGECVLVAGTRRRRAAARVPQLRALGPHRPVPRPDAARPDRRQRSGRADGREPGRARRRRSASARSRSTSPCSARRSSAAPRSAPGRWPGCGGRRLLLASRNWQLESLYRSNAKYLPDVAAALHVLRVRLRPAARRHGRRQRRGLPDRAVASRCCAGKGDGGETRWTPAARSTRPPSSR